jgi:hypothetical protein
MKDYYYFAILGIASGAIALALTGTAFAAPADSTAPVTTAHSRQIEHYDLLREFSLGLGVDVVMP